MVLAIENAGLLSVAVPCGVLAGSSGTSTSGSGTSASESIADVASELTEFEVSGGAGVDT